MKDPSELSPEQRRALGPAVRVVEAGPGSGKTRVLVARFLEAASDLRRGVALLSFTNAAVDEVRRRAGTSARVLGAPNFVGTIDAFLHRFVVTPAEVPRLGHLPTYFASWDDLPASMRFVRLRGVPGAGVPMSRFEGDGDGHLRIEESQLDWIAKAYVAELDLLGKREQLLTWAATSISRLNNRGTYDSSSARAKAYQILAGNDGVTVLQRLGRRFGEVLVDEAQDCDGLEIAMVRQLGTVTKTVLVADPDQAIYEFRGSDPTFFLSYRAEHAASQCAVLSTNHRSTAAICRAVTALRVAGTAPIMSAGNLTGPPVLLLGGTPLQQRDHFLTALGEHHISVEDAIVLAHGLRTAADVAGRSSDGTSAAAGNRLASACAELRRPNASSAQRLEAVKGLERLILSLVTWPDDLATAGRDAKLEAIGRQREWLRTAAGQLVSGLARIADRQLFGVKARKLLQGILEPLPMACASLGALVKKPSDEVWRRYTMSEEDELSLLPFGTIHGAKGAEYDAVLVALSATSGRTNGVLDDWEGGRNTEARRVLYVGASRARRLLAFGAGPHSDRVARLLELANTPLQRL